MALKTDSITFRHGDVDKVFSVTQLPAVRALKLATKLGKLLGPALPDLLGATGGGKDIANLDISKLGGGLQKLLEGLDAQGIDSLLNDLLQGVTITSGGKRADVTVDIFNNEFSGHLRDSLSLLTFMVKVNFSDFFGGPSGSGS